MCTVTLRMQIKTRSLSSPAVTPVKMNAKQQLYTAAIMLFYILQKCLQIFLVLRGSRYRIISESLQMTLTPPKLQKFVPRCHYADIN